MKKTLFTALLLMASAFTAGAQGFRVYKTDGQVYQFHWAADSIAFFEGEGDPDYQEPVPESVQTALADMQARIDANAATTAMLQEQSENTKAELQTIIETQRYDIQAMKAVQAKNEAEIDELKAAQADDREVIAALQAKVDALNATVYELKEKHAALQEETAAQETRITENRYYINMIGERVAALETKLNALKNQ